MFARLFGHVTQHGEDDEAGKEAGGTVDATRDYGIPETDKNLLSSKTIRPVNDTYIDKQNVSPDTR